LGPKMQVQGFVSELQRLAADEAGQVFETVRARVMASGAFGTEPSGIAGLAVLVRAHPTLEPQLLEFIERLPSDKVGAWVVSGWSDAIKTSEGKGRFDALLDVWKGQSKNQFLRAAAGSVQRTSKGTR
jgi:hypothetical protein